MGNEFRMVNFDFSFLQALCRNAPMLEEFDFKILVPITYITYLFMSYNLNYTSSFLGCQLMVEILPFLLSMSNFPLPLLLEFIWNLTW